MPNDKIKQAMIRAADWLEANPDGHARMRMAARESGQIVGTMDPRACRFCALGRMMHELGIDTVNTIDALNLIGDQLGELIYRASDLSREAGIVALRRAAMT
ncbi:MAG: hypothetical protein ACTHJR_10970 [Sphingomonas sp.]|uniref:hypothetical protein n=1 Tax=Sphingomonas sp. TaxID=28214 RepID=UPI003F822A77